MITVDTFQEWLKQFDPKCEMFAADLDSPGGMSIAVRRTGDGTEVRYELGGRELPPITHREALMSLLAVLADPELKLDRTHSSQSAQLEYAAAVNTAHKAVRAALKEPEPFPRPLTNDDLLKRQGFDISRRARRPSDDVLTWFEQARSDLTQAAVAWHLSTRVDDNLNERASFDSFPFKMDIAEQISALDHYIKLLRVEQKMLSNHKQGVR